MIEYQRLVSALADWRARNGLPTHPPEFETAAAPAASPPLVAPESIVEVDDEIYEDVEEAGIEVATELSAEEAGPGDYAHAPMTDAYAGYGDDPAAEGVEVGAEDLVHEDLVHEDLVHEDVVHEDVALDAGDHVIADAADIAEELPVTEDADRELSDGFGAAEATVVADGYDDPVVAADEMEVDEVSNPGFDVLEESADESTVIGELPADDDGTALPPDLPPPPDDDDRN